MLIRYINKSRFVITNNRLNKNITINLSCRIINFRYNYYCSNLIRDRLVINALLCTIEIILLQIYSSIKKVNKIETFLTYSKNLDV